MFEQVQFIKINTVCRKCHGALSISELTFCREKYSTGQKMLHLHTYNFFRKLSVHLSADIYSYFFPHPHCRLFCENTHSSEKRGFPQFNSSNLPYFKKTHVVFFPFSFWATLNLEFHLINALVYADRHRPGHS